MGFLPPLRKKETALLIIDMQNDFCKPDGYFHKRGANIKSVLEIIPRIRDFLEFCREEDIFRIFVKTVHTKYTTSKVWASRYERGQMPDLCVSDSWGSEIVEELRPRPDEPTIVKHRYSAFIDTDLPLILRSKEIKNLFITGTMTNVCIESTARHAFMLDYLPITVRDCVATPDVDLHEASLRNLEKYFGYVALCIDIKRVLM